MIPEPHWSRSTASVLAEHLFCTIYAMLTYYQDRSAILINNVTYDATQPQVMPKAIVNH